MPVLTKINTNSIAEDAITGDKFAGDAYLANTANQNISGTYSENRLYTSDAYTLSGNATVNSHLTLSSVKPTADVVLTAGGAYTITGKGVLSGGSLLAKASTDLTGMTGELGSTVIGAPALTGLGTVTSGTYNASIGSTATFPAGHIIQYVPGSIGSGTSGTTSETFQVSDVTTTITFTAGNYIYANGVINIYRSGGADDIGCQGQLSTDDSAGTTGNFGNIVVHYSYTTDSVHPRGRTSQPVFGRIQPSGTSVTVRIKWRAENGGTSTLYKENCKIDLWEVQA